jgi:hypothetical protein
MMPGGNLHEYGRQHVADRVRTAERERKAKMTRRHQAGVAKRASMIAAANAWMVRLLGGGGGI